MHNTQGHLLLYRKTAAYVCASVPAADYMKRAFVYFIIEILFKSVESLILQPQPELQLIFI